MNLKIFTENIDPKATNQIYTLLGLAPFKDAKVRIMPDVHAGAGCVIGFTANLGDKVIPNIVGVDIGCGVIVAEFGKVAINLEAVNNFIKTNIPSGKNVNDFIAKEFDITKLYCYNELKNKDYLADYSLCSLGGGNHFIEIDTDAEDNKYLVIHSGSRNLGKQVADIYQDKAIKMCHNDFFKEKSAELIAELKAQGRQAEISDALKDLHKQFEEYSIPKDLCFLEGELKEQYLHDMRLCQVFAKENRKLMIEKILKFLSIRPVNIFESVHNYIGDDNIVRKGAISAYKGEKVIIPLNMRDGSIIGIGKGNEDWNYSAPHGAGRIMSRSEARANLQLEDFKNAMQGIYTTTVDRDTIDEAPMVYKNAQEIIDKVSDTIEITNIITPIYNFKACE